MAKPKVQSYGELSTELPTFPPRRMWRVPEPIGIGTAMVESFTSYIERFALANRVLVRDLLRHVWETLSLDEADDVRTLSDGFWTSSSFWLNGVTAGDKKNWACDLTHALSKLTDRTDLEALSLLAWAPALSRRALLRKQRAWCAECYRDWYEQGKVMYSPLLWYIEAVVVCPIHHCPLSLYCPNPSCGREQRILDRSSEPGRCSHCNTTLGQPSLERDLTVSMHHHGKEWLIWVANAVGEMVAALPAMRKAPLTSNRVIATVRKIVQTVSQGSSEGLCHMLSLSFSGSTIRQWMAGQNRPRLDQVLELSCRLKSTPLLVLTQSAPGAQPTLLLHPPAPIANLESEAYKARPAILTRIRGRLVEEYLRKTTPTPTVPTIARDMGISTDQLWLYFPEECRQLKQERSHFFAADNRTRMLQTQEQIKRICAEFSAQGIVPTQERVMERMPANTFRDPKMRRVWRDTIDALGVQELVEA